MFLYICINVYMHIFIYTYIYIYILGKRVASACTSIFHGKLLYVTVNCRGDFCARLLCVCV